MQYENLCKYFIHVMRTKCDEKCDVWLEYCEEQQTIGKRFFIFISFCIGTLLYITCFGRWAHFAYIVTIITTPKRVEAFNRAHSSNKEHNIICM